MERKYKKYIYAALAAMTITAVSFSCSKSSDPVAAASSYLYMSTGLCYAGNGFTPPLPADVGVILSRLNLGSLNYEIVRDYGDLSDEVAGTFANGIVIGNHATAPESGVAFYDPGFDTVAALNVTV